MTTNFEKINPANIYTLNKIEKAKNNSIKNKKLDLKYRKDSFEKQKADGSSDNKFAFSEAAKNFLKGTLSPLKAIVQHPIISIATVAIAGLACTAIPVLTPVMAVGFGALSTFQLGKGVYNSIKEYKNGNYDNAEKSFQDIGAGAVGVATSAIGVKQSAKIAQEAKMMNKLNTNFLTSEQKAQAAQNISKNSFLDNLKEITSLITTKEGRSAFISQFKPGSMKAKLTKQTFKTGEKEEISKKEEIENFKKSEEGIRRANLSDDEIQKEFQASFDKAFDEMGIPKDQRPKLEVIEGTEGLGGQYDGSKNVLSLSKNGYKSGAFELDSTCAHEATHYKESVLRARLSQGKIDKTVQDELISRIINGESEQIVKRSIFGVETMEPPKMNSSMRADFAELAKSKMYNKDAFYVNDLKSELTALIDKYPDFVSQFNSKEEALQILKDYSTSHHFRFNAFTRQGAVKDVAAKLPALTPEEELQAIESLKNYIPTMEGNARTQTFVSKIAGVGTEAYNQYQFSPEEVLAEQNGNKHLISQLKLEMQNMKNEGALNKEQEKIILDKIKRAQATIDFKTKGLEYYNKYEQFLHNPSDAKIAQELVQLENELKILEDATKMYKDVISYSNVNINLPANIYALLSELDKEAA